MSKAKRECPREGEKRSNQAWEKFLNLCGKAVYYQYTICNSPSLQSELQQYRAFLAMLTPAISTIKFPQVSHRWKKTRENDNPLSDNLLTHG
jgi:hypothetical protein